MLDRKVRQGNTVLRASTPYDSFWSGIERVTRSLSVSVSMSLTVSVAASLSHLLLQQLAANSTSVTCSYLSLAATTHHCSVSKKAFERTFQRKNTISWIDRHDNVIRKIDRSISDVMVRYSSPYVHLRRLCSSGETGSGPKIRRLWSSIHRKRYIAELQLRLGN